MKKQEFKKKMSKGLGTSRTTLNVPTSKSWEFQEERKSKSKILNIYLNK